MRVLVLLACLVVSLPTRAEELDINGLLTLGNAERGRLVFGQCRTCHYVQPVMGHNSGPNLSGIFGSVAGKQAGFEDYSAVFRRARFVWTPQLMYRWLENPMAMFPESTMMARGIADPVARADLIAYLQRATLPPP